jgi:uncharacterized protein YbjT (DUF2867 family)
VRCLIIGCGCRGQMLARELVARGFSVRGTTRSAAREAAIVDAGAEAVVADPARVSTLVGALDHVSVVCVLLGSAVGSEEELQALHTTRLEMLLTKIVDTTVRGVVYEARGSVEDSLLADGAARVRTFAERSLAGWELLQAAPHDAVDWAAQAVALVERVLAG